MTPDRPADATSPTAPALAARAPSVPAPSVATDTSPTWELELLVSGAVIFALFQIPGALGVVYDRIVPQLAVAPRVLVMLLYWFAIGATVTLIACFVFHLAARAYWVGLVGLHSVFPGGPVWSRYKAGPITRAMFAASWPTLPRMIARVDNVCSVIFAFAFVLVMTTLVNAVLIGVAVTLAQLATAFGLSDRWFFPLYVVFLAPVALLPVLVRAVDRDAAPAPGSPRRRFIEGGGRFFARIQLLRLYGTAHATLMTNYAPRVIYPVYLGFYACTLFGAIGYGFVREGVIGFAASAYFEDAGARSVRPVHYESQWAGLAGAGTAPSVPHDVVTGPYVRLFIPYALARQDAVIRERCPGVAPIENAGVQFGRDSAAAPALQDAVLACVTGLHAPTLNGAPLDVPFRFHEHARSGRPGIVAYVPAARLRSGENVFTVREAPSLLRRRAPRPARIHTIPVWR